MSSWTAGNPVEDLRRLREQSAKQVGYQEPSEIERCYGERQEWFALFCDGSITREEYLKQAEPLTKRMRELAGLISL
jgi:hypothetical protein